MLHKLVIASVVLGVVCATPFLPHDPNVAAARARFIQEYNRLAALAAAAPDVNIIMDDRTHPSLVNNHLQQQQQQHSSHLSAFRQQPQQHSQQLPVVRHQQQQPLSLSQRQPPNPAFNQFSGPQFSFSTSLGDNQQFFPQSNFNLGNNQELFSQSNLIQQAPRRQHSSSHLAGHRGSLSPTTPTFSESNTRWTGPMADTVPAGLFVNGLPQQVRDTPEVAAAKEAHFRAHSQARANNPVF